MRIAPKGVNCISASFRKKKISFKNMLNNKGLNIDPCRTPEFLQGYCLFCSTGSDFRVNF